MDAWDLEGNFPDFSNSVESTDGRSRVVRISPGLQGSEFSSEYILAISSEYSCYARCSSELEQTADTYPDDLKNSISPRQSDCQQSLETGGQLKEFALNGKRSFRTDGKMSESVHFFTII